MANDVDSKPIREVADNLVRRFPKLTEDIEIAVSGVGTIHHDSSMILLRRFNRLTPDAELESFLSLIDQQD